MLTLVAVLIWIAGIVTAILLLDWLLFRRWLSRWGATTAELQMTLPGDDGIPRPRVAYTQAVTIDAPPDAVWPWLLQMGGSRGGLYSYDWLENLFGCDMHSANRVVPEWQNLKAGDMVKIMPAGGPSVETMEPNRLVLMTAFADSRLQAYDRKGPRPAAFIDQTWLFCLQPTAGGTRLITRWCVDYGPSGLMNWFMWDLFAGHGGAVMQRKMLLGIKARAERLAQQQAA
jgi:hypothetical protein